MEVVERLVAFILLVPFIGLNAVIGQGKQVVRALGRVLARVVPEEEVATPQIERYRRRLDRLLGLLKVVAGALGVIAGIAGFLRGQEGISLAFVTMAILSLLAFRNGADLGRTVVYAGHDAGLLRERGSEVPGGALVTRILAVGLLTNALFLANGRWSSPC